MNDETDYPRFVLGPFYRQEKDEIIEKGAGLKNSQISLHNPKLNCLAVRR